MIRPILPGLPGKTHSLEESVTSGLSSVTLLGMISSFLDQRQLESASNDPVQRRNSSTQCLRQLACNALRVAPQKHVPTRTCFLPTIRGVGGLSLLGDVLTSAVGYTIFIGATLKQGHGEKHQPTGSCRIPRDGGFWCEESNNRSYKSAADNNLQCLG